jgi:microcystin-dependent protein
MCRQIHQGGMEYPYMARIRLLTSWSVASLALSISPASAQDRCVALVQNGLFNTFRTSSGNSNLSQAQTQFCSDFNSFKQSGVQGNLGVSFGLFSGSANVSQSQIEAVGQAVCSSSLSNSAANSMLSSFSSVVDPSVTAAFTNCVNASSRGLIFDLQPSSSDPNTLTISAHFELGGPGSPVSQHVDSVTVAQSANLNNMQSVTCDGPLFTRANQSGGVTLDSNVLSMTCVRSPTGGNGQGFSFQGQQVFGAPARVIVNTNLAAIVADFAIVPTAKPVPPPTLVPVGTVVAYAGDVEPAGWMKCDGHALSRSDFADLFNAIGIGHGSGDGVGTFNIPDYRGRFLRGVSTDIDGRDPDRKDRTAAQSGGNTGARVGSIQPDIFAKHDHGGGNHGHRVGQINGAHPENSPIAVIGLGKKNQNPSPDPIEDSGNIIQPAGGSETRPINANVQFIIKVKP